MTTQENKNYVYEIIVLNISPGPGSRHILSNNLFRTNPVQTMAKVATVVCTF